MGRLYIVLSIQKNHCDIVFLVESSVDILNVILKGLTWLTWTLRGAALMGWLHIVGHSCSTIAIRQDHQKLDNKNEKQKLRLHADAWHSVITGHTNLASYTM